MKLVDTVNQWSKPKFLILFFIFVYPPCVLLGTLIGVLIARALGWTR